MNKLKTPEEYIKETFGWNHETSDLTHYVSYWKGLIKQAQIDAIQIAVERCAEEARINSSSGISYSNNFVCEVGICKDSILNVATKMKKEINNAV